MITVMVMMVNQPQLGAQLSHAPFRTGIDLVSLNVTVSTSAQQYVGGLDRDDFVVLENGVPQNVTFFAKTAVPLALALLLDSSASMEQAMAAAQEAAIGFSRTLGPADLATIIDFDTRVETAQGFTSDVGALEDAIRRTAAGGSTALFNAVYIALKELSKVKTTGEERAPRRRAIIVLSDGDDTSSLVSFEEVLDAATRSDTVIYTIGLGVGHGPGPRSGSQEGAFILRRLAEQTGGRAFFPKEAKDLAAVYGDIREELSSQYSLAYESSSARTNGEWRRIAVRVNRPSVIVRTRQGYFAPRK
jgi:Ca-activated chloride channel family protein